MKREFLTELGLESEQVDKIMAEHGKSVNSLKEENDKLKQKADEAEELKEQIKSRDEQLEKLSKSAKGNEELEKQIKELQEQNENVAKEYQEKLESQQKEFAIINALKDANVHDAELAKNALEIDSVTYKDGKIYGLDEQVSELKENKPFLFKQEDAQEKRLKGNNPHVPSGEPKGVTPEELNKMTYKERVEFKNENPELYQKLTNN